MSVNMPLPIALGNYTKGSAGKDLCSGRVLNWKQEQITKEYYKPYMEAPEKLFTAPSK